MPSSGRSPLACARATAGYTQETLAEQVGVDRQTISRWERGTQQPWPIQRRQLAEALDVSLSQLAELLQGPHQSASSPPASISRPASRPAPTFATGLLDQFDEVVHDLREQWHYLVRVDNLYGPRLALARVLDQLAVIDRLLPHVGGSRRDELAGLEARYAESAAWLYEDAGDLDAAVAMTRRAMERAEECGNRHMVAWTLFRRSQQAAAHGDAHQTISLARASRRDGDALPGPMRAAALQQEAHGYAAQQHEVAAQRALDQAHWWAASDTTGEARTGHGGFCTESYLELQRAACWLRLGHPQRAISLYDTVLPTLPPVYRRDRGAACAHRAHAYLASGEPEHAATVAHEALAIARSAGSHRTEHQIHPLGHRLRPFHHLEVVDQLLHDLDHTTP